MHQWPAAEGCSRYLRMLRLHLQKAGLSSNSKVSLQILQSELEMARELLMPQDGGHAIVPTAATVDNSRCFQSA